MKEERVPTCAWIPASVAASCRDWTADDGRLRPTHLEIPRLYSISTPPTIRTTNYHRYLLRRYSHTTTIQSTPPTFDSTFDSVTTSFSSFTHTRIYSCLHCTASHPYNPVIPLQLSEVLRL
ncbi:hypothetical protein CC2G_002424 [Coprinopsis cinerea AmutBmut pab1-1]|nr:hypothetical protein CC2G_002424 [Coprinopsis cinerea AmutBmut pab1-1]